MDKELAPAQIRKRRLLVLIKIVTVIVLLILILILFRSLLNPGLKRSRLQTAYAELGTIEGTITASGVVIPEAEQALVSPFPSRIDSLYKKAGDHIQQGEPILKLNNEMVLLSYRKQQDEYELTQNRQLQLQLSMERELIDLNTQLEIMKLQVKSCESRLEAQELIFNTGGGARANLDQAGLELDIARLQQSQLEQRINNQRQSLTADLKELELQLSIQSNRLLELETQLELAKARSMLTGVITWVRDEIGISVNSGEVIARIADLERFKVEARISDIHASRLQVRNPVRVRVGEQDLNGFISSIKPAVESGVITFLVELDNKSHPALRSNMRVDVYVIIASKQEVVRIKNGPFLNGSGRQEIFVISGRKAIRRSVLVGLNNFDYAEIETGLKPGEEVIISDTESYRHRREIIILNK